MAEPGLLDFLDSGAAPAATPLTGREFLYPKSGLWYYKGSDGVEHVLQGVPDTRLITAGAGLTGGGALTADRTIDVAAGDGGLYIAADSVFTGQGQGGTFVAASKAYAVADRGKTFMRSNSGSAMTDTLPALTNTAADIGYTIKVHNLGTAVAETITFTALAGTFFSGGATTYVLRYGSRQTFVWNGTAWVFDAGNSNLLRFTGTSVVAGNAPSFNDVDGRVVLDSGVGMSAVQASFKGRKAAAGTGALQDMTGAEAKTILAIVPGDVTGFDTQVRTSRIDQMAVPTSAVNHNSQKLQALADGTVATDAVNLGQLTGAVEGRQFKDPVACATTAAITLSGEQTIDGFLTSASRVLVKNQAATATNGLYVSAAGAWTRTLDANTAAELSLASVLVQNGTLSKGDIYTSGTVASLGVDPVVWVQTGEGNTLYAADGTSIDLTGITFSRKALSGDVSAAAGSATVTVAKIQGSAVTTTPPTNGQVLQWISASSAWVPFSYAGDVQGGPSAATVAAIRGTAVSSTAPLLGQELVDIGGSYVPSDAHVFNVLHFGADPGNSSDSTLAFYNALIQCALTRTAAAQATTTAQVTATGTFSISVGANTLAASGTIIAQTTLGGIIIAYTGGGGGATLTGCTITNGVSGGIILSGSIIGVQNPNSQGGIVFVPPGLYQITKQIVISWHGVQLKGVSAAGNTDASTPAFYLTGGAFLNWNGAQGECMLTASPIPGAAFGILQGLVIRDINLSCRGSTGYGLCNGLQLLSCYGFELENIYVYDPISFAYKFDVLANGTLAAGTAHDCTRGTIKNLKFRCLEQPSPAPVNLTNPAAVTNLNTLSGSSVTVSAALTNWPTSGVALFSAVDQLTGVVLEYQVAYTGTTGGAGPLTGCTTIGLFPNEANSGAGPGYLPNALMFAGSTIRHADSGNASAMIFHGSLTANTCCNALLQMSGVHLNGAGMLFVNCDSNLVYNPMINRAAGGAGVGVDLHGATAIGGASGTCRNNVFYGGSAGSGGARARGTNDLAYTSPSLDNYWHDYEVANGEPTPTLGLGATFFFNQNGQVNANPALSTETGARMVSGRLTTTQTVTGTALADVAGLSFPIIQPGVTYEFESLIYAVSGATGAQAFGVGINLPAGATLQSTFIGATSSAAMRTSQFVTSVNTAVASFLTTTGFTGPVLVKGIVVAGTATSHTGTVQVRASAQGGSTTSIAGTATVQAGSYLRAVKIG